MCHNHSLCKRRNSHHSLKRRKQSGLFRYQLFPLIWEGYSTINFSSVSFPDCLTFLEDRYQTSPFQLGQTILILSDSGIATEERLQPCCIRHQKIQSLFPGFLKCFLLTLLRMLVFWGISSLFDTRFCKRQLPQEVGSN